MKRNQGLSQVLSTTKWVIGLYFKNYPVLTTIYFVCEGLLSLGGLFNAYVLAIVTDQAITIATKKTSAGLSEFVPVIVVILGTYIVLEILRIIDSYARRMINFQDWMSLRKILYEQLALLGISKLENPEITNKSQRFMEESNNITNYLDIIISLFGNAVQLISASIVLLTSIPLVALVFTIIMIIEVATNQRYIRKLWVLGRDSTEERRRAISSSNMISDPSSLKELMITKGRRYLTDKVEKYFSWIIVETEKIRRSWSLWQIINTVGDAAGYGFGLIVVLKRLVSGVISVGRLTFEFRSLRIFADSFEAFASNIVNLRESAIRIGDVHELFTNYSTDPDGEKELSISKSPLKIEFRDVSFKYPNAGKYVIEHLNLSVKPGEKIAIVGENGAGKTTLVKLICRLYRVTKGEIIVGDQNLNILKISSWYKKLGVLFQDFNVYSHLTVKENIEIGNPRKTSSNELIRQALQKANALDFVEKYKNGINQVLSERYKGGIRPSTGQWQKLAIARFFYRDAPILVFDEPTASIDAVSEAQIFDNIYEFTKNKTVIIVSHRFSTVRNADRIIVLDGGKIVEDGSHEELLKNNGKYARAFNLQAKGYQ